ncbi:hypothetical protein HYS54_03310 [Candidatus Micrarchaeota archaeon]|nr:hypothetical protein [Candidatus Micrarchaeota archaeon]
MPDSKGGRREEKQQRDPHGQQRGDRNTGGPRPDFKEMRERAFERTREALRQALVKRDWLIVQAVRAIDLLDRQSNLVFEHLRDWYSLHFPEIIPMVQDQESYAKLVAGLGARSRLTADQVRGIIGDKGSVEKIAEAANKSAGADFKPEDIAQMQEWSRLFLFLRDERRRLAAYLDGVMKEEAPNINAVIGPTIGARLIETAGSLKKLSEFPSSTIQVLGAEKALFAHLHKGTKPPKHGVIFGYPKLRGAPMKSRGKIARKLSAKLSIAAKVDYFHGEFMGDKLAAKLEKDIEPLLKSG